MNETSVLEEEVKGAVDGVQADPSHGASDGVERATHVGGLDRHENAHRRRQTQHERKTSSTRRSVATETSSPNSTRALPATTA